MSHQAKVCASCGEVITDDMPRKYVPDISPYLLRHDAPISRWLCKTCYNINVPTLEKEIAAWKALPSTMSI